MPDTRGATLTGGWDTRVSRRTLLRTGGSLAAGAVLMGRTSPARAAPPFNADRPFSLGVASGDPTPDGFVLWTRLLPEGSALDGSAMTQEPYGVRYEIAADPDFRQIVRRGTQEALWEESAHGARGDRRAPVGPLVLVPVQVGHGDQRRRPDAHGAGSRRGGAVLPLRLHVVPELRGRLLRRAASSWPRRTSTSSCTSATTSTRTSTGRRTSMRGSPRWSRTASACSLSDYRTRYAFYKTRRATAGGPPRASLAVHVGRPRGRGQLRRPRDEPGDRRSKTQRRAAPRPTSPTGSTSHSRARASRSTRTWRSSAACAGATSPRST